MVRSLVPVLLFAMVAFSGSPSAASIKYGIAQNRSGTDIQVTELMVYAMRARDAGDLNRAELFWIQARAYRPSMPRPAWLDNLPPQHLDYDLPSEQEYLARVASLPYKDAKILLEKKLEQEPGNTEARQLYLELAEANADSAEITRHRSVLSSESFDLVSVISYLLLMFLIIVFIFQGYRLYRDLRNT